MPTFTVFVSQPSEEVCSLRNVTSGFTIRQMRSRLELMTGLPAQTYKLFGPSGRCYHDDQVLILNRTVWDGVLFRMQLEGEWEGVYEAVRTGNLEWILRSVKNPYSHSNRTQKQLPNISQFSQNQA